MNKALLFLAFISVCTNAFSKTIVVRNEGDAFSPAVIFATVRDTIDFQLAGSHNVVEVSKPVWDANGSVSNGGFLLPFGGGKLRVSTVGTYYFVCEPHAIFGMKGILHIAEAGEKYIARLSGMQEEFPFAGLGTGEVVANLLDDTLTVSGSFKNLTGDFNASVSGGAHIHRGLAGTSGGIVLGLKSIVDTTKKSGVFPADSNRFILTSIQKEQLQGREFYVNIHTTLISSGEIRGQLLPQSEFYYQANLFGSQEVPQVMTTAHGAIVAELTGSNLVISGSAKDLSSGVNTGIRKGGHLHLGFPGQNGGIQIELTPTLDSTGTSVQYLATNNTFSLNATQLAALRNQQLYANIHTNQYSGGEIRGQLTPMSTAKFRVALSGAYEANPVNTLASGGLIINLIDSTITIAGSFSGLEANLAVNVSGGIHLHRGMAGQNGGIVQGLKAALDANLRGGNFIPDSNTYKLTPVLLDDLLSRRLYANIHSTNFTGGEIRGQVVPECGNVMYGFFTGMQENKPVQTSGRGAVIAEVNGNRLTVSGFAERLLDKVNRNIGSHLHRAQAGANGPIVIPLTMSFPTADSLSLVYPAAQNMYTASTAFMDSLRRRQIYANIHTLRVGSGEVRAQLNHEALAYFFTRLSGASENAPVRSTGGGALFAEFGGGTTRNIVVHGSFSGLEGKYAANVAGGSHIHSGITGSNGGIRQGLMVSLGTDSLSGVFLPANNVYNIGDGGLDSLRRRLFYANVHTTKATGGEIRGNFMPLANNYYTANLSPINEVPPLGGTAAGAVKAELLGDRLTITGSFANLSGDFNRNVAGGAHIHTGATGTNGGIAVALKTDTNPDNKGGRFYSDSNSVTLTAGQILDLQTGNLYVNVHTTANAGGEIRGQLLFEPNAFPTAPAITSPAPGDTIRTGLRPDSTYSITWSAATDPDNNPLVYMIQASIVPEFTLILNTGLVGNNNSFTATIGSIDSTLALLGIPTGGSVTLQFRVLASDGSLVSPGPVIPLTFQRGVSTPVVDAFLKSYAMTLYPVPATQFALLELNAVKASAMDLQVIEMNGRLAYREKVQVQNGYNRFQIDVSKLSPGMHVLSLAVEGRQIASLKLIKE